MTPLMQKYKDAGAIQRKRYDREYFLFLASVPCTITGSFPTEFHHLRFNIPGLFGSGMGLKPPEIMCIPLHHSLHRTGDFSIHRLGNTKFEDYHEIDLWDTLRQLHERFLNHLGEK